MKLGPLTALAVTATFVFASSWSTSRAADQTPSTNSTRELPGSVQAAGQPIVGATVTLYAAGTADPAKLAEAKTDDRGAFNLDASHAPSDSVLYVVAKGGTPKAAASNGANDAIALLAVLGSQAAGSPVEGYGLVAPWAAAVDGNDHVWISNFSNPTCGIVELAGCRPEANPPGMQMGDPISPPGGYVGGGMQMQVDVDIDPAGNVWVSNNWQDYKAGLERVPEALSTLAAGQGIVVFYGMAKPVHTPLIGPVQQP